MKDLRIEIRFKNALLWNLIDEWFPPWTIPKGNGGRPFSRVAFVAEQIGIPYSSLLSFLTLKRNPFLAHRKVQVSVTAQKIANFFHADVESLFPRHLYAVNFPSVLAGDVESSCYISLMEAQRQKLLPAQASLDEEAIKKEGSESLETLLAKLSPRKQTILRMRFGFEDGNAHTLQSIAQSFGLSRDRIRQIEARALRDLRKLAGVSVYSGRPYKL